MIGFLVGTLCLIALLRVLRSGRGRGACGHGRGCGGGWGRGAFGGHGHDFGFEDHHDAHRGGGGEGDWRDHPYRGGASGEGQKEGPRDRWQRHEHDYRDGHGRHDHADAGVYDDEPRGPFGGLRGKAMLWEAFRRLDTTPGQEKVIRGVIDDLRARRTAIREELAKARSDAAKAMRGEQWDENALGEAVARIDSSVDATRKAIVEAMAKTHEALDDKQRNILADLIERGGFRGFGGGRGRRGFRGWA